MDSSRRVEVYGESEELERFGHQHCLPHPISCWCIRVIRLGSSGEPGTEWVECVKLDTARWCLVMMLLSHQHRDCERLGRVTLVRSGRGRHPRSG